MAGEIISERRATSNRNGARDHPGIPGDFSRNPQLLALIGERADLTLEEIRGLLGERGVRVGVSSVWRFFDRHGISFKKNRARRRAATRRRGGGAAGMEKPPAMA
jgi:hypothetical protein